jgi:hypothetical protein
MSAYIDLKALIALAPEASDYTIWSYWNAGQADDNTRYIVLLKNGGPSDEDIDAPTFNVWFVSKAQDDLMQDFYNDVEAISKFLSKNFSNKCVFGLNVVSSASGARPSEDGRFWSTMDVQVLYSNS